MGLFKTLYETLVTQPRKIKVARKYFNKRFGPAFFLRPAYCADCNENPVYNEATAQEAERINWGLPPGTPRIEVGTLVPSCPECNWVMEMSSWDRFQVGFLDGSFTVEEFEKFESKDYANENFVTQTLNQKNR